MRKTPAGVTECVIKVKTKKIKDLNYSGRDQWETELATDKKLYKVQQAGGIRRNRNIL